MEEEERMHEMIKDLEKGTELSDLENSDNSENHDSEKSKKNFWYEI